MERIDARSLHAFDERLLCRDAPLIVAGSVDEEYRRRWSPPALRRAAGGREVSVVRSVGETFEHGPDGEPRYDEIRLPFDAALDLVISPRPGGHYHYIRAARPSDLGVEADGLPGASIAREPKKFYLWVSADGCVTPLHYDFRSTLLTQMHGSKEVTLFPPTDPRRMYPHGIDREFYFYSRVNPHAVDESLFPDFPSGLRTTFELTPGDTLFIPPFWWHHVRSLDVSVSASVFWPVRVDECLTPAALDHLRFSYRTKRLDHSFDDDGARAPLRLATLAAEAHARGLDCTATLLCGAATRLALRALSDEPAAAGEADERASAEESDATTSAGSADVPPPTQALVESGRISERDARQALLWMFLADFAALHGKAPAARELEAMLAGVSDFAARCSLPTGTPPSERVPA